jgi:hypothetical protein
MGIKNIHSILQAIEEQKIASEELSEKLTSASITLTLPPNLDISREDAIGYMWLFLSRLDKVSHGHITNPIFIPKVRIGFDVTFKKPYSRTRIVDITEYLQLTIQTLVS